MVQHNLSVGVSSEAEQSLAPENREGARYRFNRQTEIVGYIASRHRKKHFPRRLQSVVHFDQKGCDPLDSCLSTQEQQMVFCML